MANSEHVTFEEAETPLIRAALAVPWVPNKSSLSRLFDGEPFSPDIKHALDNGEIYKQRDNGWIYFRFPDSGDGPGDNRAQVWAGIGSVYRDDLRPHDTLQCSFQPGVIDEGSVTIRVTDRIARARRLHMYGELDPNIPARKLLLAGVEWIVQQTESLRSL